MDKSSSQFLSGYAVRNCALANVLNAVISNDPESLQDARESLLTANDQICSALNVVAQCALDASQNHLENGVYANDRDIATTINFLSDLLHISNDAMAAVMRQE